MAVSVGIVVGVIVTTVQEAGAVVGGKRETILTTKIKGRHPEFQPLAIVDVGANKGEWSTAVRSTFPDAKFFMLEATSNKDSVLHNVAGQLGNAEYRIAVMSETAGQKVNFYEGGDTGNSMFQENTHFYANDVPVERITSTLDEEIERSFVKMEEVDIIKIDVQGAEVVVLKGGPKALSQATFVQLETGPISYNSGGACFHEVDELLRSHGFFWYDLGDLAYNRNLFQTPGLGQFDVLYVKPSSPKLPDALKSTRFCGYDPEIEPTPADSVAMPQSVSDLVEALDRMKRKNRPGLFFLGGFLCGFGCLALLLCFGLSLPSLALGCRPRKKGY
jgi:FkbM family methyltransferase